MDISGNGYLTSTGHINKPTSTVAREADMKATNPLFMPVLAIDSAACNSVSTWTSIHNTRAEEYTKMSNGWLALIKILIRAGNMMTVCEAFDW